MKQKLARGQEAIDEHFRLSMEIDSLSKQGWQASGEKRDMFLDMCRAQIAISSQAAGAFRTIPPWKDDAVLPLHLGFYHLFLYLERTEAYLEAIELGIQARDEGWEARWPDRWDKRIARASKKLAKSNV